jgi:hypothetical protein
MNADYLLQVLEETLLQRNLNVLERQVLLRSWQGEDYGEMAQNVGYAKGYLRLVGSKLWQDLSAALGKSITKKNLRSALPPVITSVTENSSNELDNAERPNMQHPNMQVRNMQPHNIKLESPDLQQNSSENVPWQGQLHPPSLEVPGGPLQTGSKLYVERPPIEHLAYNSIEQPGALLRIKAPWKMGKSSLTNRIIEHAKYQNYDVAYLDFQVIDEGILSSLETFLLWFCAGVSRALQLETQLDQYWQPAMGYKMSCEYYFEEYLLTQISKPIVLILNEVNRVFKHATIAQDFLPLLRSWYEKGKREPIWQKLRLVVVHSTEVYVPLKLNQSPFNVGSALKLFPFNLEQVVELGQRYGLNWSNSDPAQQLMWFVGGHPYLVNTALYHLRCQNTGLTEVLQMASTYGGIYSHHLRSYLTILQAQPELAQALQKVVAAPEGISLDAITAYRLESLGLVELKGYEAKPSCELYRHYFDQELQEQ